jgi:deoxyribonuclease IV
MRFGRHMPTASKPVRAAALAKQIGCNAIQIFASNPTAWKPPADDPEANAAFKEAASQYDLDPVVLHAPYLINLGAPDPLNWERSVALLTWTLQRGAQLGARYVVFHTGSHRGAGAEAGVERVVEGITRVLAESPSEVMLLLENDVGAGHSLGRSFELLQEILKRLPQFADRLGVCLDTAHLWGAGYDIASAESALQVLQQFADVIGTERLRVIHLNDTEKALGSHRDVHARLGEGVIGEDGLRALLQDPRLEHVAVLMETPVETDEQGKEDWVHDAEQIAKAKKLTIKEL